MEISRHRTKARIIGVAAAIALMVSIQPITANAAVNDGVTRSFDAETVGVAPSDCGSYGDLKIANAVFGGKLAGNRALRLTDQSTTQQTIGVCDFDDSMAKTVSFEFSTSDFTNGFIFAQMGDSSASTYGVWRFALFPQAGGNATLGAFDGSSWVDVLAVPNVAASGVWHSATISMSLSTANILIDGHYAETQVKAASSTTLSDVYFASFGTPEIGSDYYFDNLHVTSASSRTFNGETLNSAPVGCATMGATTIDAAAFGGVPSGNRALHVVDQSASSLSKAVCTYPETAEKAFSYRFSAEEFTHPTTVAILGASGGAALGVWRFALIPNVTYGGAVVQAYDGAGWQDIGYLPALGAPDQWASVSISATLTRAVIASGGVTIATAVRASSSTALSSIEFASEGTGEVGTDFYVDDLYGSGSVNTAAFDGVTVVPLFNDGLAIRDQPTGSTPVARFLPQAGRTISDYSASVQWGSVNAGASLSGPDSSGYITVSSSHTFTEAGAGLVSTNVTDSAGTSSNGVQLVDVTFRKTTVAVAGTGTEARFPSAAKLDDGTLLAAWYEASEHQYVDGVIKSAYSTDDGDTWSTPVTLVDIADDPRDPKLTVLSDGTILMSYFVISWSGGVVDGMYLKKSTDGGGTWSSPTPISTQMACSCGGTGSGWPAGWAAAHGPIVELSNGDLLAPLYGTLPSDGSYTRATVVRSTDGGSTWDDANEVTIGFSSSLSFEEPNLSVLPSGEIVGLIRTTSQLAYITRSFDDGYTWSTPTVTDLHAESHDQLLLSDGSVLLTYGDVTVLHRPTFGVIIDDPSLTWSGYAATQTLIYDSGEDDQANPSSVELSPGEFLTLGYDVASATLYAVFTEASDY